MNIKSLIGAAGIFAGCAVASFTVVNALDTGSNGTETPGTYRYEITDPLQPIALGSGEERAVFEDSMNDLRSNDLVKVTSVDESGVCMTVKLDDATNEGCVDADAISTGIGYTAFGRESGGFTVMGIVPDTVDSVSLGGVDVEIVGNVWSTELDADDANAQLSLVVQDTKSGASASLGG